MVLANPLVLPYLQPFFSVMPIDQEQKKIFWDEALPQQFDSLDSAKDAANQANLIERKDGKNRTYVVMSVNQSFVYATCMFTVEQTN